MITAWPVLLAFTSVMALPSEDRVTAPDLDRWVIGYEAHNATQAIREEVPESESVKDWSRMVTTQRFGGLAALTTAENYVTNIARSVERKCPGAQVGAIRQVRMTGRPAVRVTIDCPVLAETGKRETFLLEATGGTFDILVKQVAFRGPHSAADIAWATGFLDALVYCAGGTTQGACTREPAPQRKLAAPNAF
ncbi:hypothetical protein [Novosphingobium sp.]|uniref:hypothetical protein n=1 Tax=Novosphingobium sp. TaxID=1874826 RepID=UPI0025FC2D21|nr:hypothetical protein [Novosphingobium sp.]